MRLADFILQNVEPILAEWEAFARGIWPGEAADPATLRDHAEEILRSTASDMTADQTGGEQTAKSRGEGEASAHSDGLEGASHVHGALRVDSGFDLLAVVSEYRALRASVIRLWRDSRPEPDLRDGQDLTRFNESIDQSLTKAVRSFTRKSDQQRRAELAHLSRAATLGELTATLAHEVAQPLTAIMSNAAAAQRSLETSALDPAEMRDTLADIYADTRRASEVVRRLRAMLQRGKPVEFAPLDLNDVIRSIEQLVRGDALRKQIVVELDLARGLPPTPGDPVQLQQVVMNLMLNAFAAMDRPELPTRRLLVRTRAADGHVEAEFRDTGAGISADVMDRIFEPFVTTKPQGLGMGLTICRSIVDRHRGWLRAANNPAGGATFSLTLPAAA
jgi:signal transduction histidine kinase